MKPKREGRHVEPTGDRPGFKRPDHKVHKSTAPKGHKTAPPKRKER